MIIKKEFKLKTLGLPSGKQVAFYHNTGKEVDNILARWLTYTSDVTVDNLKEFVGEEYETHMILTEMEYQALP